MSMRDKCKAIVEAMRVGGIKDLVPTDWIDSWSEEDCEYIVVNYGSWIGE